MSRYCHPLFCPLLLFYLLPVFFYPFIFYLFIHPPLTLSPQARPLLSLSPPRHLFEDDGLGTSSFLLSSTQVGNESHSQPIVMEKSAGVRQHKHTATLCRPARPPLWIYMHDVGFLKWIYLKLQASLKGWAVIFSPPPHGQVQALWGEPWIRTVVSEGPFGDESRLLCQK